MSSSGKNANLRCPEPVPDAVGVGGRGALSHGVDSSLGKYVFQMSPNAVSSDEGTPSRSAPKGLIPFPGHHSHGSPPFCLLGILLGLYRTTLTSTGGASELIAWRTHWVTTVSRFREPHFSFLPILLTPDCFLSPSLSSPLFLLCTLSLSLPSLSLASPLIPQA